MQILKETLLSVRQTSLRHFNAIYIPATLILLLVALTAIASHKPVEFFTRDMAFLLNGNSLTGYLSNLGSLVWAAAVAICFFTSSLLFFMRKKDLAWFYIASGLLTVMLLFDDLYMLHDYLGVFEKTIYVIYIVLTSAYLFRFRQQILRDPHALVLIAALFWFASSVFVDVFLFDVMEPHIGSWAYFAEDSAKFLGIVNWCGFFSLSSFSLLSKRLS